MSGEGPRGTCCFREALKPRRYSAWAPLTTHLDAQVREVAEGKGLRAMYGQIHLLLVAALLGGLVAAALSIYRYFGP
jgi:hypothetical protein